MRKQAWDLTQVTKTSDRTAPNLSSKSLGLFLASLPCSPSSCAFKWEVQQFTPSLLKQHQEQSEHGDGNQGFLQISVSESLVNQITWRPLTPNSFCLHLILRCFISVKLRMYTQTHKHTSCMRAHTLD